MSMSPLLRGSWELMATSSPDPSSVTAALEEDASLSLFFSGQWLEKCPISPHSKHLIFERSFFFFGYFFDAKVASSSSSFFTLLNLGLYYLLVNLWSSSWCRIDHKLSQSGRSTLPKILSTNISHLSVTALRVVLNIIASSIVAPVAVSWSLIDYSLKRKCSMSSPLVIMNDVIWVSNKNFLWTNFPSYREVKAFHISLVVFFSAMCGTIWSLILSIVSRLACPSASLCLWRRSTSVSVARVCSTWSLRLYASRTIRILAFQTKNFERPSSLSWSHSPCGAVCSECVGTSFSLC